MYSQMAPRIEPRSFHDALYAGEIGHFADVAEMQDLVSFTRIFLETRFAPCAPPEIHRHVSGADLPTLLSSAQREYGRSREAKDLWRALFEALGLAPDRLARDRLVVRFQPPVDHVGARGWSRSTATVGFHRDTWGTNLYSQVNWWAPVYPISAGRTFALFPALWDVALANTSQRFDMAEAMRRVREAGPGLKPTDLLPQLLEAVDPADAVPVVIRPGSLIAFSAQHAHAGVTNHTGLMRISLDTRTLWIDDFAARRGSPNVDGYAHLTAPGMFHRLSDGASLAALFHLEKLMPFEGPRPASMAKHPTG